MIVRPIETKDIETMVWMGAALAQESPVYRTMKYGAEKTQAFLEDAADPGIEHIAAWVVEYEEKIIGFMVGYTSEHPYFLDIISWDGTLYISPNYRGKARAAIRVMVEYYVEWAKKWDGPIKIGITTGIATDGVEKLLNRCGFKTTGKILDYVWAEETEET